MKRTAIHLCGLGALLAVATSAHAALFDDDEARRQIVVERKRIDDLTAQNKANIDRISGRLDKIDEALKSQPVLDLFNQLQALKAELSQLRGQIEVLNNNIENSVKRQRDMYVDLDTRLRRFEQPGGAAPAAGAPATSQAPAGGPNTAAPNTAGAPNTGNPPATTPPASAANNNPGIVLTSIDNGPETRVYEAAQGQRRAGNFQLAIVSFQNFIKQYPKSALAPRAQYWIGDSYFNMRDFKLAIANQQTLMKNYPDSPSVPDALLNVASSQMEMGDAVNGKKTLEEVIAKFPTSDAADKARRRLAGTSAKQ